MKVLICLILTLLLYTIPMSGQVRTQLTLQEGYRLLEDQYPLLQNKGLIQGISSLSMEQLKRDRLPSLDFQTEGRYQSQSVQLETEGTALPFEIDQPLYSLRSYVEANYLLYDGGMNAARKKLTEAQTAADLQQVEVSRFGLQQEINQLFVNIHLIREQGALFDLSLTDLQARKAVIRAGVEEGALLPGELSQLEVRELELTAQQADLVWQEKGLIGTLSQLIGTTLSDEVELIIPNLPTPVQLPGINRPEQGLFLLQRESVLAQTEMVNARRRPKLSLFAQAGVGAPNPLNLLDQDAAPFGLVGAGFSWKILDWKKAKTDREILALQARQIANQEETFTFKLESREANYLAAVNRLKSQIKHDEEIAALQTEILKQAAAQLDEGIITSSEYVQRVNAELRARQNLSIHRTELVKTQLEFWNERGAVK